MLYQKKKNWFLIFFFILEIILVIEKLDYILDDYIPNCVYELVVEFIDIHVKRLVLWRSNRSTISCGKNCPHTYRWKYEVPEKSLKKKNKPFTYTKIHVLYIHFSSFLGFYKNLLRKNKYTWLRSMKNSFSPEITGFNAKSALVYICTGVIICRITTIITTSSKFISRIIIKIIKIGWLKKTLLRNSRSVYQVSLR